jgi:MFS transporter, ACS family, hexuronate transporter
MSQLPASSLMPDYKSLGEKPTRYRWVICALLFFATTINYLDRSVINVVGPTIKAEQHWTDYQYGLVSAAFTLAYALGFIIMGKLIDAIGVRITYAVALAFWSLAAAGHALAGGAFSFGIARFFLGLGEAGNFPAAIKTVAEWFPQKERATATGIFNAGSNVGAILAPIIIPIIVLTWHWQAAFILTGLIGMLWVLFWIPMYRSPAVHPRVNQAERALILGGDEAAVAVPDAKEPPVKWRNLLPHRQAWAFMIGKFLTDPVWWFYLFFGGIFFTDRFGVSIKTIGIPLIIIYLLADIGSIAGGWLSSTLIHRGWTPNAARKTAMFTCALCVLPVIFAPLVPTTWISASGFNWGVVVSATLIGIAAAAHQGFSANIFTLTSDMFPKKAVGSVVGLGGFSGAVGGMIMATVAGLIKEVYGNFVIMFIGASVVYILAVVIVHLFVPGLKRLSTQELQHARIPVPVWCVVWAVVGFLAGVPLSYTLQNHALPSARSFPVYMADVMSGDIFKITKPPKAPASAPATGAALGAIETQPAASVPTAPASAPMPAAPILSEDQQKANRAQLGWPLLYTPFGLAAIMACVGALVHGVILRRRSTSP